jgi:hypothetical protein
MNFKKGIALKKNGRQVNEQNPQQKTLIVHLSHGTN